ncbi:MAG: YceI family protein [Cyclobacteriaceae bacterium]
MKQIKTLLIILICLPAMSNAQRLMDRNGKVHFFSEAPLEDIEATNKQALAVLDLSNGKVAVSMLMKGFHFEKSLMEEHFNENYVESDKHPKASFSGQLEGFDASALDNITDSLQFPASGKMSIHGVTKDVETVVTFTPEGGKISVRTQFWVKVDDYDIDIPKMVISNIAEEVLVTAQFSFERS